jgi:hypothetical protein
VKGQSFKDCLEWYPDEKNVFHVIEKSSGKEVTGYGRRHGSLVFYQGSMAIMIL